MIAGNHDLIIRVVATKAGSDQVVMALAIEWFARVKLGLKVALEIVPFSISEDREWTVFEEMLFKAPHSKRFVDSQIAKSLDLLEFRRVRMGSNLDDLLVGSGSKPREVLGGMYSEVQALARSLQRDFVSQAPEDSRSKQDFNVKVTELRNWLGALIARRMDA